jgi:hypothetical protein
MTQRRMQFEHDGHSFQADEQRSAGHGASEAHVRWVVRMNGVVRLEFEGAFPYRDEDVRKRVVEWYEIQKPRPAAR